MSTQEWELVDGTRYCAGQGGRCLRVQRVDSLMPGRSRQCTSSEPRLRPLQNGDKRFMIQSHKHAYSRDLISVRFCDDLIQLWPRYLHFSERKKHREVEELSQVIQWEA